MSQKRGLSSDFERLCGSEACSSDLQRSSGSCGSFIEFYRALERGPPSDAKCAIDTKFPKLPKPPRTVERIFV